jgi:hypothetical protein
MTRLPHALALEFIESIMECSVDLDTSARIEAFILDKSVIEVSEAFDAFTAERGLEIDEDSVIFKADIIDICDDDCTMITILTAEGAMQ